jgi:serpin B
VPIKSVDQNSGYGSARKTMAFDMGNSIWLNKDYMGGEFKDTLFAPPFESKVQEYFHGTSSLVNKENKATAVNKWIEEKTNGKIKNAMPDGDDFDYLSALVNTVYFKAEWQNQFDKRATKKDMFTNKGGVKTEVNFMNMTSLRGYYENSKLQAVEIPYFTGNGSSISMYVFLPKAMSSEINANDMEKVFKYKSLDLVSLSLPKFSIEFKDEALADKLEQLGIIDAFDEGFADFRDTYINLKYNAYIEFVIHQAFIEIDEEGTEAAAATIVGGGAAGGGGAPPIPKVFIANRPFTYVIRNNGTGDIYFMGCCRYLK